MDDGLNERTRGWLRFLWDKTQTPDDWSSAGTPLPWWDRDSTAPMCSFPRFDLAETAYALPVLADRTPAWREVYARMADEIVGRHTTFWAAIDWITLIGHDPDPDRYPPEWLAFLPPHLQGRYDPPGWTANGVEPWGLQPDPIGADGNLFFRGFFNLILAIYRYVAGDEKWERPFAMTGYRDRKFEWTHHRIAEFLHVQWKDRPQGPHCENTKIWPFCVSGAGLGLKLTDATTGTRFHGVYDEWVEFARRHYLRLDSKGRLASFPLYYDPIEEVVCTFPNEASALAALIITPYVLPQNRELGEFLYREAVRIVGWSRSDVPARRLLDDPRFVTIGLLIARELGDVTTERRLREIAEREFEPRWFGEEKTRFGWWFGLDEPYPRGQLSALLALCDAGEPGAWLRRLRADRLEAALRRADRRGRRLSEPRHRRRLERRRERRAPRRDLRRDALAARHADHVPRHQARARGGGGGADRRPRGRPLPRRRPGHDRDRERGRRARLPDRPSRSRDRARPFGRSRRRDRCGGGERGRERGAGESLRSGESRGLLLLLSVAGGSPAPRARRSHPPTTRSIAR